MNKIVNGILALVILTASIFAFKYYYEAREARSLYKDLAAQYQTYDQKLGRAEVEIGSARSKIAELEKDVQAEIERYNGSVTAYGKLSAKYNQLVKSGPTTVEIPTSVEAPVKEPVTPFRLYWSKSEYDLVQFPPDLKIPYKDKRLALTMYLLSRDERLQTAVEYTISLRFSGQFAEVTLPNGDVTFYADLFEVDENGKKLNQLEFQDFIVTKEDQRASSFKLAPHVDIGGVVGAGLAQGNLVSGLSIGVSGWGYGKTQNDLLFRFPRLALAANSDFVALELDPVLYNLGDPLPVVSNIWVGPGILWNPSGFGLVLTLNSVL